MFPLQMQSEEKLRLTISQLSDQLEKAELEREILYRRVESKTIAQVCVPFYPLTECDDIPIPSSDTASGSSIELEAVNSL